MSALKQLLAAFMAVLPILGMGQQAYTLQQALDHAVKNNYSMRMAEADMTIAKKQVAETRAIGFPKVHGTVDFSNFLDIATTLIPAQAFNPLAPSGEFSAVQFGTEYNTSVGLTATQMIFNGSYIVGLQASRAYQGLSKLTRDKSETDVKEAVAQAYYTALVAEENKAVLKGTLKHTQQLLSETGAMQKAGFMEEQDVDQLRLTVSNMENMVAQAERMHKNAHMLLKLQMGVDMQQEITLSDKLETIVGGLDYEAVSGAQFNSAAHPDLLLVQTNEQLQKLNLRNERMAYLPSASAFFSHSQNRFSNDFDVFKTGMAWYPTTLWGIKLTVPISDFGVTMGKTQRAKLELEKAGIQKKQVEQSLILQSESARNDFMTAWNTYQNEKSNLTLAERIQDQTLVKYKSGVASSMELTQAQTQYQQVQGSYINSIFQLLSAKSKLDKALNTYK